MKTPPKFKLNRLDREVMGLYELDPKAYTLKELSLAHQAEAEKCKRIRLEVFLRAQSIEAARFLDGMAK